MDCNKDEAARAKDLAERKLVDKDFVGAKNLIIKVQQLSKEVGDIDIQKMLIVCDVHCAARAQGNVPIDWYGILQVPETADETQIKKQYHKLALLLHPDKNKFGGAEAAFKLVGEANKTLTDRPKRSLYDMKRITATPRTFWTMCPSCGTRYQHYIVVLKKALCCQYCLKQFIGHDLTEQAESSESSISETSSDNEVVESSECSISKTSSDKEEIADHGSAANDSDQGQRSRQVQEVKYNEEKADVDFVNSPSLKRLRKSGMLCGDDNKKTTKLVEEIAGHNGMTDGANNCSTTEDEREGGSSIHGLDLDTNDASDVVPQGDTLRFSHCVPHHVVSGTEKEGIPEESLDLDPAALSLDLEGNLPSIILESSSCKGSMNVREGQHTTCMNPVITAETPKEKGRKHDTCSSDVCEVTDVDEDSICQTIYVHAESEFCDFSQRKLLQKFSPRNIWAIYSAEDNFPKYYGFIQKVDLKNGEVQVRWLDVCPHGEEEKRLLQGEGTIGCGIFRLSHELSTYTNTDAFSHCVDARSTSQKGEYEIIPHVGEIWAVYKNWRVGWTGQDFGRCKYELVEILDYTGSSIRVQLLRKVDGYRMVFMPYEADGSVKTIRKDEYPKFSHQIPCFRLTCEKGGKLQGFLELDPLSLPEEFLNVNSQNNTTTAGLSSGNNACKGSMNVREGQHTTCLNAGIAAETPKEESRKHNACSAEVDEITIGQTICVHAESESCDFSQTRLLQKFLPGKIWALYSDKDNFPNYYGFIHKVDLKNGKVQVRWLDVCPHGEEEKRLLQEGRTIACGTFRLSNELMTYTNIDVFSQCVDAISTNQKGKYEIVPHLGEIWAVYKNWRVGWTAQDFGRCEYELVEILGYTGSSIRVQLLRKVDGYRMIFMPYEAEGSVKTIRKDEYPKFSHQIPCFHLTCEKGGKLRRCVELDPLSLPEEFLNVR